jgi:hypothetical protein
MIEDPTPARAIELAVASGDRRRRWIGAVDAVAAQAPVTAAALVVGVVLTRVGGGSGAVMLGCFAASLAYLVLVGLRAAWPTRKRDVTAARLDADAHLHGALRSAHWFATQTAGTAWTSFHLKTVAHRLHSVNWRGVYTTAPSGRRVAMAVAGTALALTIVAWPDREPVLTAGARSNVAGSGSRAGQPPDRSDALEAIEALALSEMAPAEARAAIEDLLRDPTLDAGLRRQLETMLSQQEMGLGQSESSALGEQDPQATGGMDVDGAPPESDDVEWAESEAASRAASEEAQRGSRPPDDDSSMASTESEPGGTPTPGSEPGDDLQRRERNPGAGAGLSLGDESEETDTGGEGAEGLSSAGGGKTEHVLLDVVARETARALAREVVRAIDAPEGKNIQVEEARRTEARRSAMGFDGIERPTAYDRATSDPPTVVPETRRVLLERYFIRDAQ